MPPEQVHVVDRIRAGDHASHQRRHLDPELAPWSPDTFGTWPARPTHLELNRCRQRWLRLLIFVVPGPAQDKRWTGFLQSTLQNRRGPLLASLIVVPFFALFHLPARFVAGWIVDDHTPLAQVPTVALGYFA
jgi:hypothetical protein